MAALTDEVKLLIVKNLACYDTPSEVVNAVKVEFGLIVSRQQVEAYDPTKQAGRKLNRKWKAIFEHVRYKFIKEFNSIPITHRNFRLRMLNRMLNKADEFRNYTLAIKLLEQAARECGGMYISRGRT